MVSAVAGLVVRDSSRVGMLLDWELKSVQVCCLGTGHPSVCMRRLRGIWLGEGSLYEAVLSRLEDGLPK